MEGRRPQGDSARYGEARMLLGRCRANPARTSDGLDYGVSNGVGWARRSQQRPWYRAGHNREGPNSPWIVGDRPEDSAGVEQQECMTDQLSLFEEEAVVRISGGG